MFLELRGFVKVLLYVFNTKLGKYLGKRMIYEKQGDTNVLKCEYRMVIRTSLPDFSGGLLQDQGKLAKRLSFLYSSYRLSFLTVTFLPLTQKFFMETRNLFVSSSEKSTSS